MTVLRKTILTLAALSVAGLFAAEAMAAPGGGPIRKSNRRGRRRRTKRKKRAKPISRRPSI